jgi:general secretion pathway protein K
MMRDPCGRHRTAGRPQQGFALLIVLWTLVLLALVITRLTSAGRSEAQLTFNLRNAAMARAAADGGFYEAVFHLIDSSGGRWTADGTDHSLRVGGSRVDVYIASEAGKINPNSAQPQLMAALLHQLGADTRTAAAIAGAMADWRFPGD